MTTALPLANAARIVTVYSDSHMPWELRDMSFIRWLKISEGLARMGHQVDIATNEPRWREGAEPVQMAQNLRRVPLKKVDWKQYDVVKTVFHKGFQNLLRCGGAGHPFIISKLGSVVGPQDMPGIYFYGKLREDLYATQVDIARKSRYVTLLSQAGIDLWKNIHGNRKGLLLVPGGVDREIPPPGVNPYPNIGQPVCIFSGNIYSSESQPEANRVLTAKLNELGRHLSRAGLRLCFLGVGETAALNPEWVTNLGSCPYEDSWNYLHFATVGIVVSAGPFMQNNESSKIYHYLRAGLPVVSESGFPNDHVVGESGLGFVVRSENMEALAEAAVRAANTPWNREGAIDYILTNHTWDQRAAVYKPLIQPRRGTSLFQRLFSRGFTADGEE